MKKLIVLCLTLVLFLSTAASAGITAIGAAEVRLRPDIATVFLGVSYFDSDVATAQSQVNSAIASVREGVYALGVLPDDIAVDGLYMYTDRNENGQIGYNVSHQLNITVRDINAVGSIIDAGILAGANQLNGISFDAQNKSDAYAQALKLAVADAKNHAAIMAEAASLVIKEIDDIKERFDVYDIYPAMERGMDGLGSSIDVGSMTVRATVEVNFDVN